MFTAEEAYVRRGLAKERAMGDFRDEVARLDAVSEVSAGISSFTTDAPTQEVIAARPPGEYASRRDPWRHVVYACTACVAERDVEPLTHRPPGDSREVRRRGTEEATR